MVEFQAWISRSIVLLAVLIASSIFCSGQYYDYEARGPALGADRTNLAHVAGVNAGFEIKLQDEHKNARDKRLVVNAAVTGIELVDPNASGDSAQYQGFLQYRLDGSAPIETKELHHEFGNLSSGKHVIEVALVTKSRANIVEPKKIEVEIP